MNVLENKAPDLASGCPFCIWFAVEGGQPFSVLVDPVRMMDMAEYAAKLHSDRIRLFKEVAGQLPPEVVAARLLTAAAGSVFDVTNQLCNTYEGQMWVIRRCLLRVNADPPAISRWLDQMDNRCFDAFCREVFGRSGLLVPKSDEEKTRWTTSPKTVQMMEIPPPATETMTTSAMPSSPSGAPASSITTQGLIFGNSPSGK